MQLGHRSEAQTWDYIVDVAEFAAWREKLKGIGLDLNELEPMSTV